MCAFWGDHIMGMNDILVGLPQDHYTFVILVTSPILLERTFYLRAQLQNTIYGIADSEGHKDWATLIIYQTYKVHTYRVMTFMTGININVDRCSWNISNEIDTEWPGLENVVIL